MPVTLRIFGISIVVTIASLIAAFVYDSWTGVALCLILGILEVSLSFDNAVINATVLERMSEFWQRIFLTVGVLIAVFGMRLVFPLVIVWVTAGLDPVRAFSLAMNPPADGGPMFPDGSPSYETILKDAHPQIAAFGGMFLFMLFLNFIFSSRDVTWMRWIERPLAKIGKVDMLSVVVAGGTLLVVSEFLAKSVAHVDGQIVDYRVTVLTAGLLGMITYIAVDGLGNLFHTEQIAETDEPEPAGNGSSKNPSATGQSGPSTAVKATGKAAFFLFIYLEVLDASFSFDGVIGAFAITPDPIIIALGLGLIGAMFVRSITVYLVRQGTLAEYRYLEHGAHWAIGALAIILFLSIQFHINEIVTGLVGVTLIGAAFISSIIANRREATRSESPNRKTQPQ